MSYGWVKVHRSLLEWEWYDDMNTKCLYLHCLLRANHSDKKWRGQEVKRGQFITSLESLGNETGLTVSQIRTSIRKLISTGNLASKSQAKNRIITVLNYDSYQDDDKQVSKPVTSKSQGSDKVVTTDKNDKNDKNKEKRKVKTLLPSDFIIDEDMSAWFANQGFVVDINLATERWIDAMKAGGYKYVDWVAAWRNGMKKANDWQKEKQPQQQDFTPRGFSQ